MTGRHALLALAVSMLAACNAVTVPTPAVSTPGVATPEATTPTSSQPPAVRTASPSASPPAPSPSLPASAVVGDRYPDGLPRTLDGVPVLRGTAALAHAAAAVDDTPFMVTGWVTYEPGPRACGLLSGGPSWLNDCVRAQLSNVAGAVDRSLTRAITFHFVLDGLTTGPVVVRVRVHDPRAAECGSAAVAACDRLMVVQQVVWAGDEGTDPRPLSAATVTDVVRSLQPRAQVTPIGPGVPATGCGNDLETATEYAVSEPNRVRPIRPYVTRVEIEPSIAARERALDVAAGARAALRPSAVGCTSFSRVPSGSWSEEYHWLAIANVVLLVRTDHRPSAADRAFVRQLARRLQAASGIGR